MSAAITGTQPHQTNEKNPQVNDHGPGSRAGTPPLDELTPDQPPSLVAAAASTSEASVPETSADSTHKEKRRRGFAAMDRTLVSEIARKGGKAAHSAGTAHEFTSEEARVAGRKGGRATHAKRTGGGAIAAEHPAKSSEESGGER